MSRPALYLNRDRFDELVLGSGMSMAEFSREADVSPVTISLARNGRPVKPSTLRKLARGLERIKQLKALDGVVTVAKPNSKKKKLAERVVRLPASKNVADDNSNRPTR